MVNTTNIEPGYYVVQICRGTGARTVLLTGSESAYHAADRAARLDPAIVRTALADMWVVSTEDFHYEIGHVDGE
jgi:hypothetical protein